MNHKINNTCPVCGHSVFENEFGDLQCEFCRRVLPIENTASTDTNIVNRCPICNNWLFVDKDTGRKNCVTCGYLESNLPNLLKTTTNDLINRPENNPSGLMGWICPKCGRGLSPYTNCCPCSIEFEIKYDTNLTKID